MRYNYRYVFLFFAGIALVAFLIFPGQFDLVIMYRNSYLYNQALRLLDRLEEERPEDTRVDLERAHVLYLAGRYDDAVVLLERLTLRQPRNALAWRRLAATYRALQRPRDAMAAFEHLVEAAPADSVALHLLDDYYRWFQMTEKAVGNLQALTRYYPEDRYNWNKLFDLYVRTDNVGGAIETLDGVVSRSPDSLEERIKLGRLYLIVKDPRAVAIFEDLHGTFPDREDIVEDLIAALVATGRQDRAVDTFEGYYRERLDPEDYTGRLVDLYVSIERPGEAARALEERLRISPSEEIRYSVALLYQDAGQYRRSLPYMEELIEANPDEQEYRKVHISLLKSLEEKEKLVSALEDYVRRWPEDWEMVGRLADACNWNGAYAREVEVLERLRRRYPDRDEYHRRLGEGYYALKQYGRAAEYLVGLVRRRPDVREYRDLLLSVLRDMPPGTRVLEYARLLHETAPDRDVESALFLAELYSGRKQYEDADRIYGRLVRDRSGDVNLLTRIGKFILDQDRPEKARGYFQEALRVHPDSRGALEGMADAVGEDSPLEALRYLRRLNGVDPDRPETAYRMASIYESLADTATAVALYRRFLDLVPRSPGDDSYFLRQKAHARFRTGAVQQAVDLLAEGRKRYPEDLEIVNDYAAILIHQKKYDQAMAELDRLKRP